MLNGQRHPAALAPLADQLLILLGGGGGTTEQRENAAFKHTRNFLGEATGCSYPARAVAEDQLEGARQGAHNPGHRVPLSA